MTAKPSTKQKVYLPRLRGRHTIFFVCKDGMREHFSFAGVSKGRPFGTQLCLQSVVCYTALPTDAKNEVAPYRQTHFEWQENEAEYTSGEASIFRPVFRKAWWYRVPTYVLNKLII